MIRIVQRRLIIPRGDTGSFSVPSLIDTTPDITLVAIFSIFNARERIFTKKYEVQNGMVEIKFTHEDTDNLPVGIYKWDIKMYVNPRYENEDETTLPIDGDEVNSYYAGFTLPECEITLAPTYGRG